jgi:hypothetical protein
VGGVPGALRILVAYLLANGDFAQSTDTEFKAVLSRKSIIM